jgi:hypothetical protein
MLVARCVACGGFLECSLFPHARFSHRGHVKRPSVSAPSSMCGVPSTMRCHCAHAHAAELGDGPWPTRCFLGAAAAVLHLDDASTSALTARVGTDGYVSLPEGLAALAVVASSEESEGVPPRVWDLVCAELRKCHRVSPR